MDRAEDRDELLFTRLWVAAQPAVASTLVVLLRDRHAVEDALQEAALAAYRSFADYDTGRSFTAWAIGIARHKAIDALRRRGGSAALLDAVAIDGLVDAATRLVPELGPRELALHACLGGLTARAHEALRLRYVEDHDLAGIAALLRISVNHAKVVLHRAREALRACIDRRLQAEAR